MGDHMNKTMQAKPMLLNLEDLYQGIPDESVNLTFQDLADLNALEKKNPTTTITTNIEPVSQVSHNNPTKATSSPSSSLAKLPSLDFTKGLQASNQYNHHHQHHQDFGHGSSYGDTPWGHYGHHHLKGDQVHHHDPLSSHASGVAQSPRSRVQRNDNLGYSMSYDAMSVASSGNKGGGRRRSGIPHSKICSVCSTYVYVFRTRCLVCGRVYCWRCVGIGMGEMVEGRKCVECLGLRFSQRYMERAGKVGCCSWRYPSTLKQAELMCAEKGPRRSARHDHSGMRTPRSRSTPAIGSNEHSFVMSSSFSTLSPHHNLPF